MDKLTDALDPAHQQAQDDDHAHHSFKQAHLFTMMQQLHDSQVTIKTLWNQVSRLQGRIQALEVACAQSVFWLEMLEMSMGTQRVLKITMPVPPA